MNFFDPDGTKRFYTLVVLYEPSEYSRQADDEAKWLANAYDEDQNSVIKTAVRSKPEFIREWNKYLNKENKDYIVMSLIFHGGPKHLYPGENLMVSDIKSLNKANLISLRILSCNAGHKDYSDNVANAFKNAHQINSVYAMDGGLSFYPRTLFGHDFSRYGPRLAHNQSGFTKYAKNGRKPTGFYVIW